MKKISAFILIAAAAMFVSTGVFAGSLTERDIPGAYEDKYDTVGWEDLTIGSSSDDTFTATGDEIILLKNTTSTDSQVTIVSVSDNLGRKNDLTDTVPSNNAVMVGPMEREGWEDSSGNITISTDGNWVSAGDIQAAIIRLQ